MQAPQGYILALDQGTTSSRAMLFDHEGKIVSSAQREFTQFFPKSGWVEHDPDEIWSSQAGVATEALTRVNLTSADVHAIGITNQRETTIVWDRATGKPVYRAIVWQDRRTAKFCDELKAQKYDEMVRAKTGLPIDSYFSATKIRWILDNDKSLQAKAERGELAFGTVDSWLMWKFTKGECHVTDITNASRTLLFNIHTQKWDTDLLKLFNIPASMLPEVRSSSEIYGKTNDVFASKIPLAGIAGDQHAALFGQMCTEPGMVKNTYGTGCFLVMNTGDKPIESKNNLVTTIAWKIGDRVDYALEGSIFIGGAIVQWLRDGLKIINHSRGVEPLAASVKDNGDVYVVPAFTGLGAPHWNADARGSIFGLTRDSQDGHIARAALESIAYQSLDVLRAMETDSGIPIPELRVDGGAASNNLLMQFQADLLGAPTVRPTVTETTALGAAYLAGLATGYWDDIETIKKQWKQDIAFEPSMDASKCEHYITEWHRAVDATITWANNGKK